MSLTKLNNGLTIIGQPTVHQTIHLAAFVKAGTKDEGGYPGGTAHFIEHMLFKGTNQFTAQAFADEIDAIGGEVNAYTTKEYTCYTIKTLARFEQRAVHLLKEMLCYAVFPVEEISREIRVIQEEIKMTEDDPEEHIYEVLQQLTLNHALAQPILGTNESVATIKASHLHNFYRTFYQPSNMIIGYVGNRQEMIENYFADWDHQMVLPEMTEPFMFNPVMETSVQAFEQAHVIYGYGAVSYYDALYDAFSLFSSMFGESMSCPLFRRLREELGLCYNVYSALESFKEGGLFTIYIGCDAENVEAVDQEIKSLLSAFKTNLSEAELQRGKDFLIINAMMNNDYDGNMMMRSARHYLYYGEIPTMEQFEMRMNAVTVEQMLQVLERLTKHALIKYMN